MQIQELKAKIQTILALEGDRLVHQWQALGYAQALRDTGVISSQECTQLKDFIFA